MRHDGQGSEDRCRLFNNAVLLSKQIIHHQHNNSIVEVLLHGSLVMVEERQMEAM